MSRAAFSGLSTLLDQMLTHRHGDYLTALPSATRAAPGDSARGRRAEDVGSRTRACLRSVEPAIQLL